MSKYFHTMPSATPLMRPYHAMWAWRATKDRLANRTSWAFELFQLCTYLQQLLTNATVTAIAVWARRTSGFAVHFALHLWQVYDLLQVCGVPHSHVSARFLHVSVCTYAVMWCDGQLAQLHWQPVPPCLTRKRQALGKFQRENNKSQRKKAKTEKDQKELCNQSENDLRRAATLF